MTTDGGIGEERPIWERMDGETAAAYAAFLRCLLIGPERKILHVYRSLRVEQGTAGVPPEPLKIRSLPRSWKGWIDRWQWRSRFAAYDADMARRRIQARQESLLEAEEKIAGQAEIVLDHAVGKFLSCPDEEVTAATAARAIDAMARLRLFVLGKNEQVDVDVEQRHTVVHDWVPMSPVDDSEKPDFVSLGDVDYE